LRSLPAVAALLLALMASPQYGLATEVVDFSTPEPPGTIVINTPQRKLYFVLNGRTAVRYPIAVPKRGREWSGRATVIEKLVNPDWVPPPPVRADHPNLPYLVPAGAPNNPVGARAILLDRRPVAIHGTSRRIRGTIGTAASYGCIRMLDEDVIDLFDRVRIGTPVLKIP
jgi:lipoprotein-anchoring transpeptidase ErfK/SrfK